MTDFTRATCRTQSFGQIRLLLRRVTGHIQTSTDLERDGDIPRGDGAQIFVTALDIEGTYGTTFEVLSDDTPIDNAVVNPV